MEEQTADRLWDLANTDPKRFMAILADYSQMEERLRCRLVSHETNFNYFTAGPYLKHPMGEVALFFDAGENDGVRIQYHVSYQIAQKWGRSEKELLDTALRNTEKYEKYTLRDMDELLAEMMGTTLPENHRSLFPMTILSNERREGGATSILYPGILKKIREQIGMDYFVLPTSVHELTIMPKYPFLSARDIEVTVRNDNRELIEEEDVLSNDVFVYTEEKGRLEKCSTGAREQTRKEESR